MVLQILVMRCSDHQILHYRHIQQILGGIFGCPATTQKCVVILDELQNCPNFAPDQFWSLLCSSICAWNMTVVIHGPKTISPWKTACA